MAQLEKLLQDYNSLGITSIVQRRCVGREDVSDFEGSGKTHMPHFCLLGSKLDGECSKGAEQIQKAADHPAHAYDNLLWLRGVKVVYETK